MVESSCSMNSAMATTHGKKRLTVGLSIRAVLPKSVARGRAGRFIAMSIIAKPGSLTARSLSPPAARLFEEVSKDDLAMDCVLPPAFFQRPAAKVARDLLGKHLIRMSGAMQTTSVIFETEAYEGTHDLASHSSRGRTPRTEVMFGPAGRFYVYRVYGLHWMLNI